MMKTKCYSVRLLSLVSISVKAYKATAFDGSTAILPKSHVFARDYDVDKSNAYWISAWILERQQIQHSTKKSAYWNPRKRRIEQTISVEHHVPEKITPKDTTPDGELTR